MILKNSVFWHSPQYVRAHIYSNNEHSIYLFKSQAVDLKKQKYPLTNGQRVRSMPPIFPHFDLSQYYAPAAKAVGFAIAGVIAQIALPILAPPLYAISISLCITSVAFKFIDNYNSPVFNEWKRKAIQFQRNYPYLQIICFIFALIMSTISPVLGILVALPLGVFSGSLIAMEHCKVIQLAKRSGYAAQNSHVHCIACK